MLDTLFLHHLDTIVSQGCCDPTCTEDHRDGMWFIPWCHPDKGIRFGVALNDSAELPGGMGLLGLFCWTCRTQLAQVALAEPLQPPLPDCGHRAAVDIGYSAGHILGRCHQCQHPFFEKPVAAYVEEPD